MAAEKGRRATSGYVKVEGIDELRKSLRKMQDKVAKQNAQQTLKDDFRAAAEMVAETARQRAPLGPARAKLGPGALRDTIRPKGALRGATVLAGGIKGVKYAGPIAYGWPTRPDKAKGWRGGPIKGYNFLRYALLRRSPDITRRMETTVRRLIEEVKGL